MAETHQVAPPASAPPPPMNVKMFPVGNIHESKTNPRHFFDPKKLAELAQSIKEVGVIQALVARVKKDKAELIAGARRLRAAKLAGLAEVPVSIVEMTDQQVLEIQIIENVQREDVQPLEEADGYSRLLKLEGYTVTMIAEKIGKNESYVYRRMRLSKLIEKLKRHLEEGTITVAHADLLCPLDDATQTQILKDVLFDRWQREREKVLIAVAPSKLRRVIREQIMLSLSAAPWKKDDALLVPSAGACTVCPKRSGANLALFDDLKAGDDRCLDRSCYLTKRAAFVSITLDLAKAAEKPLVAIHGGYSSRSEDKAPAGVKVVSRNEYREMEGKKCASVERALVVTGEGVGKEMNICRDSKCKVHHHSGGYSSKPKTKQAVWDEKRENLAIAIERDARSQALQQIVTRTKEIGERELRVLGACLIQDLDYGLIPEVATILVVDYDKKKHDHTQQLLKGFAALPAEPLKRVVMHLALLKHAEPIPHWNRDKGDVLAQTAKAMKVDLKKIQATVSKQRLADFNKKRALAMKAKPAAKKKGAKKK